MKHIKTFESFRMNEGILDNIKKGVKNIFTKKKDNPTDETPKKSNHKENIINIYDVSFVKIQDLMNWIDKNIGNDNIRWIKWQISGDYELDISKLSFLDATQLKAYLFLNGYNTIDKVIKLSHSKKEKIKSLGYQDLYKKALEWIKKCGYDVSDVWSWNDPTITIGLEGFKTINSALIGVRLQDGKIKVGSSPSDLKVCNGPDELKSLVDALKTTERERKQERKRLEKERLEALERSRKWRKPEKVSKEDFEAKLRHGKLPFTKREIEFLQKFKEKNKNNKAKIDLGESDTISIKYENNNYQYYTYIIKLNDEWYTIKSGYYEIVVDVTNVEGDWDGSHYEEYFVCDEFDEVLGYLERKDSFSFPDGMELLGYLSSNKEEVNKKEEKDEEYEDDEEYDYDEEDDDDEDYEDDEE